MSDALAKVKKDLGRNAVILHTRTLKRGGVLGLGARSIVEITATSDHRVMALRKERSGDVAREASPTPTATSGGKDPIVKPAAPASAEAPEAPPSDSPPPTRQTATMQTYRADGNDVRPPAVGNGAPRAGSAEAAPIQPGHGARIKDDTELLRELTEIRGMVRDLLKNSNRVEHPDAPADLIEYYTHLIGQDVEEELALQLIGSVSERLKELGASYWDSRGRLVRGTSASQDRVRDLLRDAVKEMLPAAAPLRLNAGGRPTVIAMVGPTGVGKTTTIAKLAANMKLRERKRVGLITIDSYRIAAVEQLKTYAQILKVPLLPVLTPAEMRTAIARMSDMDLILVDTAGRSQKDDLRIAELSEFIRAAEPDEVHLVLSTTSRERMIREAIDRFSKLGAEHLIFTKIDEAVGLGVILNVLRNVDMRLSYLTNGQAVPDDIEIGSAGRIAGLIVDLEPVGRPIFASRAASSESAEEVVL